jgi:hypothetical protein
MCGRIRALPAAILAGFVAVGCGSAVSAEPTRAASAVPVATSYAETCRLTLSWCVDPRPPGGVPRALRRSLHLPRLAAGGRCPASRGRMFDTSEFGVFALGGPPVQPGLGILPRDVRRARRGIVVFRARPSDGWYGVKTLWFGMPRYRGPLLIRGRQIGGSGSVAFGEGGAAVRDPQIPPGRTKNGVRYRQWPGGTWIRGSGCYGWQVDGVGFSHVIVFKAIVPNRSRD